MISKTSVWDYVWGGVLVLLILVVPVLVGYDITFQWQTTTMDFYLDTPGSSTINSVYPGGQAETIGLNPGDVILTVDDIPFKQWHSPEIGRPHILRIERIGYQERMVVPAVRVIQLNFISLASATIVALIFWGIGTLLFVRRFWNCEIRLFFLLSQTIAITVLFPLSFMDPWSPPDWLLSISQASFCLIAPLCFHYAITYPEKLGRPRDRIFGFILLYGLVPGVFWGWFQENQLGRQLNFFFFSLVVTAAVVFTIYEYQYRSTPEERRRTRTIVFGALLAVTLPVLFYLLPMIIGSPYRIPEWAAGLFLIIAPISYLYTTLQYNLFGIDRLINRTLVYSILSFGIFVVYLVPYIFLYKYLPDDWFMQLVFLFCMTLWVGWTFDWLRTRTQRLVDKVFYGGWYDFPVVVEMISDALAKSNTRDQISDVLTGQVSQLMRLNNSNLWINKPNSTFPSLISKKARFLHTFQTENPAQWTVDSHWDGDDLSVVDLRILHTLAQQAEIALNNIFLIERLRSQLNEIRDSREALAQTQHQMLRSREEERSRLARDLHDSPIQSLVGINIQLGLLINEKELGNSTLESLKEMRAEVRQLSSELRQVCADLRPPMLDTLGLSAALCALIAEWSEFYEVETKLNLCPDSTLQALPEEAAVNMYRVAQEALVNIGKHAKAQNVDISLIWEECQLIMTIEDDGIGFEIPDTLYELTARNHFGLAGMRERVNLIGGELSLSSTTGKGTTVKVKWHADEGSQ